MSESPARAPIVLVVEDEVPLRQSVARHLDASGFTVVEAGSVAEGLAAAWEQQPDVILLDVLLPDGSGYDLCARLRPITSAPIIYLTALGQDRHIVEGLGDRADDYIPKPFSLEVLTPGSRLSCVARPRRARDGSTCRRSTWTTSPVRWCWRDARCT